MKNLIKKIQSELQKPLPGQEAQKAMAPLMHLKRFSQNTEKARKGGVLLLLSEQNNTLNISLIKRAKDGGAHSGQISFPGGKNEPTDLNIIETAKRETYEEIGVLPETIKILGSLSSLYIPVSNYLVFPAVGYAMQKPIFKANKSEVEEIVNIPLEYFMSEKYKTKGNIQVRNYQINTPFYKINGYEIWGATAMIINEFTEIVKRIV